MRPGGPLVRRGVFLLFFAASSLLFAGSAMRAACESPLQGEGQVSAVLDARTLRLDDGREVRLSGIEIPKTVETSGADWLRQHVLHQKMALHGLDDMPDRYGRQHIFARLDGRTETLQGALIEAGYAIAAGNTSDKACLTELRETERRAENARRGIWSRTDFVHDAGRPDEILKYMGRFTLVEGTILSARQAGATLYLNFSKRRIQGFAVTISRRMMLGFAAADMTAATLQGQRVRVRGWISQHGGPRIEARFPSQIEFTSNTKAAMAEGK